MEGKRATVTPGGTTAAQSRELLQCNVFGNELWAELPRGIGMRCSELSKKKNKKKTGNRAGGGQLAFTCTSLTRIRGRTTMEGRVQDTETRSLENVTSMQHS